MGPDEALRRLIAAIEVSGDEGARVALSHVERELAAARRHAGTITEAIRALLQSSETYPLVFSHERDPMSLFDVETGRFLEVNDAWIALYGFSRQEALSMRVADVSAEPAETHSAVARANSGAGARINLRWHRKRDGTSFPVELTCGKLELSGRAVMYAAIRDISERIRAQEALARSEAGFRALIESLQDFVVVHRHGKVVYMNPSANAALGYAPLELVGRSVLDVVHPDDRAKARQGATKIVPLLELRLLQSDGKIVIVELSAMPTVYGGESAIIALGRDVSVRKRMEAQLIMADRLASIGRLAASVGHEINNPLAYVLGTISLMRHDLEGAELPPDLASRLVERLDVLREGAERMRDIVHQLKTLARADDDVGGSVDVAHVLDVCADMAAHEIRPRARLTKNYGPGLYAKGSEARLGQVFLNLLVNAGQAIPEGTAADHEVRITAHRTADGHIAVEVSDTGMGIRAEDLEHIFEPFFTTKSPLAGSGLGLSICHHIVTTLGGSIEARATESGGASLIVVLPGTDQPARDRHDTVQRDKPFSSGDQRDTVLLAGQHEETR